MTLANRICVLFLFVLAQSCGGDDPLVVPDANIPTDVTPTDEGTTTDEGPPLDLPQADCTTAADCPSAGQCVEASCINGECAYPNKEGACDDGDSCTFDDKCTGGVCLGTMMACDDGNGCTEDVCQDGACSGTPLETEECALDVLIEHPPRASTIDGDPNILIQGRVISPAGAIASLKLNGTEYSPSPDGSFSIPLTSYVGINPIELIAYDVFDRTAKDSRAYLYAESLISAGVPTAIIPVKNASNIWLAREAFDDDDPTDLDDIAALATRVMESFDANTMLPHPIPVCASPEDLSDDSEICLEQAPSYLGCNWTVDITNVNYDVKKLNFTPVPDGLVLSAELDNFTAEQSLIAGGLCPDCIGNIAIDTMAIEGTIPVTITPQNDIEISVTGLQVTVDGLDVTCEDGFGSWVNWLINWFEGTIETTFENLLSEFVPNSLVPLVSGILDQLLDYEIIFPVPAFAENGTDTTMHLKVSPEELELDTLGTEWTLNLGAATSSPIVNIGAGTIARNNCDGMEPNKTFWLPAQANIEASLHEDFMNQLLYVAWQAGHLNMKLNDEIISGSNPLKISNVDIEIEPMLPPVLTTCAPGFQPELQIGDLYSTGTMRILNNDVTLEFYASTRLRIEPKVETSADGVSFIGFDIPEITYLSFQMESISGLGETSIESIETFLRDMLVEYIGDGLLDTLISSYPIPIVDVSEWIPSLPEGSNVTFGIQSAETSQGHIIAGGEAKEP